MEALNSPMKKMAIDQENAEKENLAPPSPKLLEKPKEEPSEKFLVPKIVPEVENKEARILSPKKGAKVNTAYTPSYMRPTTSNSAKTSKTSESKMTSLKSRTLVTSRPSSSKSTQKPGTNRFTSKVTGTASSRSGMTSSSSSSIPSSTAPKPRPEVKTGVSKPKLTIKPTKASLMRMEKKTGNTSTFGSRPLSARREPPKSLPKPSSRQNTVPTKQPSRTGIAKPATKTGATKPSIRTGVPKQAVKTCLSKPVVSKLGMKSLEPAASKKTSKPVSKPVLPVTKKPSVMSSNKVLAKGMTEMTGTPSKCQSTGPARDNQAKPRTGTPVQPRTGTPVQPRTGTPVKSHTGTPVQPRTGTPVQPRTGTPVKSRTGTPVKSRTGTPVKSRTATPVKSRTGTPVKSQAGTPVKSSSASPAKTTEGSPRPETPGKNRGKRLSLNPNKRRRTRFSVNKEMLERELADFLENQKKKEAENDQQLEGKDESTMLWPELAEVQVGKERDHVMRQTMEELVQGLIDLKLPHQEMWDALEDLVNNQPADMRLFLIYWRAKVDTAIKVGKSREEVLEILANGENICHYGDFSQLQKETNQRYEDDPSLIPGRIWSDPEMTIADDEELELSVVFTPPTNLSFRKSPTLPEEPDLEIELSDLDLQAADLDPEMTDLDPENPQDFSKINKLLETSKEKLEREVTTESEPVAPLPSTPLKDVTQWQNITFGSPTTSGPNATFLKLIAKRQKKNGSLLVTPVRRSKRIADKTPQKSHESSAPEWFNTETVELLQNLALPHEENAQFLEALNPTTPNKTLLLD